jgi:hypothetical protein
MAYTVARAWSDHIIPMYHEIIMKLTILCSIITGQCNTMSAWDMVGAM